MCHGKTIVRFSAVCWHFCSEYRDSGRKTISLAYCWGVLFLAMAALWPVSQAFCSQHPGQHLTVTGNDLGLPLFRAFGVNLLVFLRWGQKSLQLIISSSSKRNRYPRFYLKWEDGFFLRKVWNLKSLKCSFLSSGGRFYTNWGGRRDRLAK